MSFFGFFRKSKDTAAASASAAKADNITVIEKLRDQSEMLDKRNNYNVVRIEKLTLEIKGKLSSGDKKGAMLLLQQKKKLSWMRFHWGTLQLNALPKTYPLPALTISWKTFMKRKTPKHKFKTP